MRALVVGSRVRGRRVNVWSIFEYCVDGRVGVELRCRW